MVLVRKLPTMDKPQESSIAERNRAQQVLIKLASLAQRHGFEWKSAPALEQLEEFPFSFSVRKDGNEINFNVQMNTGVTKHTQSTPIPGLVETIHFYDEENPRGVVVHQIGASSTIIDSYYLSDRSERTRLTAFFENAH